MIPTEMMTETITLIDMTSSCASRQGLAETSDGTPICGKPERKGTHISKEFFQATIFSGMTGVMTIAESRPRGPAVHQSFRKRTCAPAVVVVLVSPLFLLSSLLLPLGSPRL
jgi:hypothetical protein